MVAVHSLSESDVAVIREELSAGKQSTVWFSPVAVGVPVGGSAKVVSVGELAEGEFIQVRPAGSRDMMFCSPNELSKARPPRKRKPRPEAAEPAAASRPAPERPAPGSAAPGSAGSGSAGSGSGSGSGSAGRRSAAPRTTPPATVETSGPATEPHEPPAPAARRGSGRRQPAAEVAITLSASAEGEWSVEVTVGRKQVVRSTPVKPAEVVKAARSLPAAVTEAIETSLAAARKRQAERVEQLRAELDAAQRTLRELSG